MRILFIFIRCPTCGSRTGCPVDEFNILYMNQVCTKCKAAIPCQRLDVNPPVRVKPATINFNVGSE